MRYVRFHRPSSSPSGQHLPFKACALDFGILDVQRVTESDPVVPRGQSFRYQVAACWPVDGFYPAHYQPIGNHSHDGENRSYEKPG